MNKISLMIVIGLAGCGLLGGRSTGHCQDSASRSHPPSTHIDDQMERFTHELKLTNQQKPKVRAFLEQSLKKRRQLAADNRVALQDRREQVLALMNQENKNIKEILTSGQYAKYEKMRDQKPGSSGGGMPADSNQEKQDKKKD